jgi:hypothetical protein
MNEILKNNKNWYLVEIIDRCEPSDTKDQRPLRRCIVYGNYHLIKANSVGEAYDKAEKIGLEGSYIFKNSDKVDMKWEFIGIGDILPIYEDIEDGAELMYTDYGFISAKRSDRFVISKADWIKKLTKM